MAKRIVITGMGVISPVGCGKDVYWDAIISGKSGVDEVKGFDTSLFRVHRGCEVNDFRFKDYFPDGTEREMGKGSEFAVAATKLALDDSGLDLNAVDVERVGVSIGTTSGEIQVLEKIDDIRYKSGDNSVDPDLFLKHPCNNMPSNIAIEFNLKGPNTMIPTACAAGNYAVGYAYDLISLGRADFMIAGGADPFSRVAFVGFGRLNAIAPDICQPFDKNRKGMLIGEGAGIVVLESLETALKRNATIYAEILGYGLSCDGYHITIPHPDGIGVISAMNKALKNAKITPEDVQYVSAHGTGTIANDKAETVSVKKVFGEHSKKIMISSIKSMLGHTMGAASALETIACALVVKNNVVPPTINIFEHDPECDLDIVPNKKREAEVNIAMNNAYAFGGNNCCLVLKKFTE
ncbi:MAG: beta-ketoacyl-[acyl-carrier-protein] synthase family protein [Candidatus Anammoxibacter sp.]